jgi:chemotaxis protein histidine kinase CheA
MGGVDTLRPAFFEECEDLLARLSEGLGHIPEAAERNEAETLHDVFRAVHSIKGGAGAFGLTSLVGFAHAFETVLDLMRAGHCIRTRQPCRFCGARQMFWLTSCPRHVMGRRSQSN